MDKSINPPLRDKLMRVLLAFALLLTGAGGALLGSLRSADAAETTDLSVGDKIYYGGYNTHWAWADGEVAYCGNPSAATPEGGTYSKAAISAPSGRTTETIADLWFGYGSPGFDASMWPSTWYDGSAMTDGNYAALTHILLSDTYTSNGQYAMYGCSEDFKDWVAYNIIGYSQDTGELINANATGRKMWARHSEVPRNFEAFQIYTGEDTQVMLSFAFIPYGKISLAKTSGLTQISNGNSCYSLEGAEYTVYENPNLTGEAGVIRTDSNGEGELGELMPGTYYVKETKASPGYSLDPTKYTVEVYSDMTTPVGGANGVKEIPKSDPVGMLVMKIDAQTGKASPEGSGTLGGAEFTVRFYPGQYSSADAAEASGAPQKTWVFKTDSDGFAYYDDAYKVAGPALFRMSNGDATIPLGTVVVQETKAPTGYKLDDGHGNTPTRFCVRITDNGAEGEAVYTYNTPKSPDTIKRGDYRLVKEVPVEVEADSGIVQESKRVLLPGIKFQLINSSAHSIVSPETKQEVQPGGVVCTITTDENGLASTRNGAAVNGWSIPGDWTAALAYGTYTVHEVIPASVARQFKATYGHDLFAVPDWKMTISEEKQYEGAVLVNDHIPQTPLKVVKKDVETGKQIPLPCSFQLLDARGRLVTYEAHYPETHVMDTWTTNDKGEVMLPMLLEEGSYTLVEVSAPEGYVKALEGKTFTVGAVYNNWDNPITVDFTDMAQKATISVIKHDSTNGEPVDDSTYIVKAAADIVTPDGTVRAHAGDIMATLVTDADGHAQTQELYLGSYTVWEAKAKDGFSLNVAEETVKLGYQGQDITVFDYDLPVDDEPSEIVVLKVDALDPGKAVPGATFRVWSDDGSLDLEVVTGEDGKASVGYLKHGSYHIAEVSAPEGYTLSDIDEEGNPIVRDFVVDDQGFVSLDGGDTKASSVEVTIEDMPKTMKTTATDLESTTHEGQASEHMTIVDVVEYTGCIPGNEYVLKGTLMDKETGKAVLDADGNEVTSSVTFTAEDFTGSIELTFEFDSTALVGHDLVAFEEMDYEDAEYMVHADLEDASQTVRIVDIGTLATCEVTEDHIAALADEIALKDVVSYEGLTPGSTYKVFTCLYDATEQMPIENPDGTAYVTELTFEPEEASGEVEVSVTVASKDILGHTLVFYEKLSDSEDNIIATHEDADDEGQSIHFAAIHTNAGNTAGGKNVIAGEAAEIIDTVTYENLIPSKTYVLTGTLVDKADGEPIKDAKGEPVTAISAFVPEEASGEVEVRFVFDASGLETHTAVVFESLAKDGIEVAAHADIDDEDQTVFFPEIRTNAVDGADGDKNVVATTKAEVIDTVTYKNLVPGKDYVIIGTLMDKLTEKPAKDAKGNEVTATAMFCPGKPDGEVEVKFTFDATGLESTTAVVFESLACDEVEVAVHADITDEAQTVGFTEPKSGPEGKPYPKTGAIVTAAAGAAGVSALVLLAYGLSGGGSALLKRRKSAVEGDEIDA